MVARERRIYKVKYFSERQKPRRKSHSSPCQIAALRLHDLNRLFRARYGITLPDDDAGRDDILVAVNHLASLAHPKQRIKHWLELWAPWMTLAECETITAAAIMHQQHWTADQLAWRMRLTDADRTTLAITTIGAIDCSKADRKRRRKSRQRERMRKLRQAKRLCAP